MPHGKLSVYVEGAVHIKDTTILGKGSPYCTLTVGTQVLSSPPIPEGGTRPYFNTKFEFQVDRSTEHLLVQIFSKKTLTDDDLLGYCSIFFKEVFYHGHSVPVTPQALTRPSGRPGGHIRLSLTFQATKPPAAGGYVPPPPPPRRTARPVGPPQAAPAPQYGQPRPPPQSYAVGPSGAPAPPHPAYEPRRMHDDGHTSSQSSGSSSDDDAPGRYVQSADGYECGPRPQPGPPPARGRGPPPRPQPPGPFSALANPLALFNAVVATVNAVTSDSDGSSDWGDGGGDDVSLDWSFGPAETAGYGDPPEEPSFDDAAEQGGSSDGEGLSIEASFGQDAAGAPGPGFRPQRAAGAAGAAGVAGGRGRARARGPPPGPTQGRAGPPRGRGPPPQGRGRAPPL